MATVGPALDFMLPHEGGYSNNPADKGGPTRYGITQAVARANGYTGDMRVFPLDQARAIYAQSYWPGLEGIQVQEVANKIFDMRVNFGVRAADLLAQQAVNEAGGNVAEDGIIGPQSIDAINALDPATYLGALVTVAEDRYRGIVQRNPSQGVFLKGWMARAQEIQDVVVQAAEETAEAVKENPGSSALVLMLLVGLGVILFRGGR